MNENEQWCYSNPGRYEEDHFLLFPKCSGLILKGYFLNLTRGGQNESLMEKGL